MSKKFLYVFATGIFCIAMDIAKNQVHAETCEDFVAQCKSNGCDSLPAGEIRNWCNSQKAPIQRGQYYACTSTCRQYKQRLCSSGECQ